MKAVLENTTVAKLQDGTAESLCVSYQGFRALFCFMFILDKLRKRYFGGNWRGGCFAGAQLQETALFFATPPYPVGPRSQTCWHWLHGKGTLTWISEEAHNFLRLSRRFFAVP